MVGRTSIATFLVVFLNLIAYAQQDPWHRVSVGQDYPKQVNAIIEIPKGSKAKFEVDKTSGLIKLDRVLHSSVVYPTHYGFIPQTYCGDKDPLDILVICSVDLYPLTLLKAKVIGVIKMLDNNEQDDKIIAVAANDPAVNYINDLSELPPHTMKEIVRFFEEYKSLEGGNVTIEKISNSTSAQNVILESLELYKAKFGNKDLKHGN